MKIAVDENEIDCLKYQMRLTTYVKKFETSAQKVKAIKDFKADLEEVTDERMMVLID